MKFKTDSMLVASLGTYPVVTGYDDVLAQYIGEQWQGAIDQLSDTMFDAMIVLYLFTQKGHKVVATSKQLHNPFPIGMEYQRTNTDFIDLVRTYGRMILVEDALEDTRLGKASELAMGYENLIGIPLVNRGNIIIGELVVLRKGVCTIENGDVNLTAWLAASIESSIECYELKLMMEQIGIHDQLTRLITRDRMMEMIREEFDRSQRSEMPFSLVIIDVDNFRGINEAFGHEIGDKVLQHFSSLILDRIRHIDYACRWDGDAFVILLPQTEMIGANQLVSDLFFKLAHHIFPDVGRCYFSMGIADFSITDRTVNDMLVRLDQALYRVKAFGGNSHGARYRRLN